MKYIKLFEEFKESNKLKFVKKAKKKDAKTDTYEVFKNGNIIGLIKWSSRMRGYAFQSTKDSEGEIKDFIKKLMDDRRSKK